MRNTKFKIGDRVRFIEDYSYNASIGDEAIVIGIGDNEIHKRGLVYFKTKNCNRLSCFVSRLELLDNNYKQFNHPLTGIFK